MERKPQYQKYVKLIPINVFLILLELGKLILKFTWKRNCESIAKTIINK